MHADGALLRVKSLRTFAQAGHFLRHDACTGGDDENIVFVGLAALGLDLVPVEVELGDRVHVKIDARLEQARLISIELVRRHLPEGDIQQARLIHVPVGSRQHREPDLAGTNLAGKPPREIVGQNGAARATTDD